MDICGRRLERVNVPRAGQDAAQGQPLADNDRSANGRYAALRILDELDNVAGGGAVQLGLEIVAVGCGNRGHGIYLICGTGASNANMPMARRTNSRARTTATTINSVLNGGGMGTKLTSAH